MSGGSPGPEFARELVALLPDAGADTAFRHVQQDGIGSFHRIDRGFGYALSGEFQRDAMLSIATAVHWQINP